MAWEEYMGMFADDFVNGCVDPYWDDQNLDPESIEYDRWLCGRGEGGGRFVGPGVCPRCGHVCVERVNRRTQQVFYGCSRFPECKGSRDGQ